MLPVKEFNKKYNSIIFLMLMLLYLPVVFARTDLWDGVILSHLINIGRSDVYFEWFNEAGLFLTPFFYVPLSIHFIQNLYPETGHIVTLLFLYLSALEVCNLSRLLYKINSVQKLYVGILYLLLPVWASYFSTIYLMHAATLYLALLSARLVIEKKHLIFAFIIAPVSFQQASLAPLLLAILMLSLIENKGKGSRVTIIFGAWIILSFFILRVVFDTSGLYSDYNKISLANLSNMKFWNEFLLCFAMYSGVFIVFYIVNPKLLFSFSSIGLIVALMVCIIPYVAVAKYPSSTGTFLMHSNSMRFLFPCAPIIVFVFAYTISKKMIPIWFYPLVFAYACYLFFNAQLAKVRDVAYQRAFIAVMKVHKDLNGKIILFTNASGLTPYEYTDILTKSFGENKSIPLINGKDYFPDAWFKKESYIAKYMIPEMKPAEKIQVKITSEIDSLGIIELYKGYLSGDDFYGKVKISII